MPHINASYLSTQHSCASSQDTPISSKSCLMVSIQFSLCLSSLHCVVFASRCVACFCGQTSSIHNTCLNHLRLLSLILSSSLSLLPHFLIQDFVFPKAAQHPSLFTEIYDVLLTAFLQVTLTDYSRLQRKRRAYLSLEQVWAGWLAV